MPAEADRESAFFLPTSPKAPAPAAATRRASRPATAAWARRPAVEVESVAEEVVGSWKEVAAPRSVSPSSSPTSQS